MPSAVSASTVYEMQLPQVFLEGITYDLTVSSPAADHTAATQPTPLLRVDDFPYTPSRSDGEWIFSDVIVSGTGAAAVSLEISGEVVQQTEVSVIPAWVSILPPLVAIGMALLIRSVLPALMLGLWLGAWALEGLTAKGVFTGLFASFEVYVANAVADYDHATIMLFTFMIAGMVGVISRNGGMRGIVEWIITGANSAKRGQLAVWSLGLLIFFDDYSNTLVVGNTSRSITDRLRISREKLAYLVDSTAAPLATVALVTTWIGYQVSLIGDAIA
ncbi:MAG: Na+/H+ antiporter NhaC family protein, partial [Luminiphilus sp.]